MKCDENATSVVNFRKPLDRVSFPSFDNLRAVWPDWEDRK